MIQVKDVTKLFGTKTAVNNINFKVDRGEIVGFLGPNGAGKTTTMRILAGFLPPTSGTAIVAGFDVTENPLEVKKRIGYLPETPPLYPEMEVADYLEFVARIKRIEKNKIARRIDAVVDCTASGDVRNMLIGKLSKGYRQRVGLAQALIHGPQVLILDEPTTGLDPKQIIEVRKLISSLAGEHTIILSTHILPEVATTCNRVIIINEGRIEASDTPENLTAQLQGAHTILMDVEGPDEEVRRHLEKESGVNRVSQHGSSNGRTIWRVEIDQDRNLPRRLSSAVIFAGWGLYSMQPLGLSLEDIFLKLTSDEVEVSEVTAAKKELDSEIAELPQEPDESREPST